MSYWVTFGGHQNHACVCGFKSSDALENLLWFSGNSVDKQSPGADFPKMRVFGFLHSGALCVSFGNNTLKAEGKRHRQRGARCSPGQMLVGLPLHVTAASASPVSGCRVRRHPAKRASGCVTLGHRGRLLRSPWDTATLTPRGPLGCGCLRGYF